MIHVLGCETSNFSFLAMGQSQGGAMAALREGVSVHLKQCNTEGNAAALIEDYGTSTYPPTPGTVDFPVCFRDAEIIWQG